VNRQQLNIALVFLILFTLYCEWWKREQGILAFIASTWIINKTFYVDCDRPGRTETTVVLITVIQAVEAKLTFLTQNPSLFPIYFKTMQNKKKTPHIS